MSNPETPAEQPEENESENVNPDALQMAFSQLLKARDLVEEEIGVASPHVATYVSALLAEARSIEQTSLLRIISQGLPSPRERLNDRMSEMMNRGRRS